ncbi:hypothetical protein FQZ97_1101400 [compost metagenome]
MIEEHVDQHTGQAPALAGKARLGDVDQRVGIGEGVDMPVHADRRFDIGGPAPGQRPLDEVAVETAKQLRGLRAAEMEVSEIVHALSLPQP